MQCIGDLRSLSALQVLFHHHDNCDSMLREIRLCIIDNIVQCPVFNVEYIAVCFAMHGLASNSVSQLRRKIRPRAQVAHDASSRCASQSPGNSSDKPGLGSAFGASWDIKGKGRVTKSTSQGMVIDPEQADSNFDDKTPWNSDDSDEDDECSGYDSSIVNTFTSVSDVVGVKMWEKEVWDLSL
jgi:hypothetical protein